MAQWLKLWLRKYLSVHVSDLKKAAVERPNAVLKVGMIDGPALEIHLHIKHVGIQQVLQMHTFLE